MGRFSESIVIGVAPDVAFAYLADPSTAPVIDPAVVWYRPESLPMRVGVHNHIKAKIYGVPFQAESIVTEWEEGHRMVLDSVKPSYPLRARAVHLFEQHPEGTLYTWSMEITPSLGGAPAAWMFTRFMRRNARKQQGRLKRVLEAQ